jgi:hypothetical protein
MDSMLPLGYVVSGYDRSKAFERPARRGFVRGMGDDVHGSLRFR